MITNGKITTSLLKQKYPKVYQEILTEGIRIGSTDERLRIQKIEDLTIGGSEKIAYEAKYTALIRPETFAQELCKLLNTWVSLHFIPSTVESSTLEKLTETRKERNGG